MRPTEAVASSSRLGVVLGVMLISACLVASIILFPHPGLKRGEGHRNKEEVWRGVLH